MQPSDETSHPQTPPRGAASSHTQQEQTAPVPTEVLLARLIRAHGEALAAYAVLACVLAFLALAGSMMAANFSETPTYQGGIYGAMIALGAVVIAAGVCGWGLVQAFRIHPEAPEPELRQAVIARFESTHRSLFWSSRMMLVVIVLGIAATVFTWNQGLIGVLIAAVAMAHVWAMSRYVMSRCFTVATQLTPAGSRIIAGLERFRQNQAGA